MKPFVFLCILLSSTISYGANSLYTVKVDTQNKSQSVVLHEALQKIIDKITPGADDHENPVILAAHPSEYILSKKYAPNGKLVIQFKPEAVIQLIEKAGQQPWLGSRPKLVTWVCKRKTRELDCLTPKNHPSLFRSVAFASESKGLNIRFMGNKFASDTHEYDGDLSVPFVKKLWLRAKLNDSTVALLILLDDRTTDHRVEYWRMYYNGHEIQDHKHAPYNDEKIGYNTMTGVSEVFFEPEKIEKSTHPVDINFTNIKTLKAFYKLEHYLKGIPGVRKITQNSVTADGVLYTLDLEIPTQLLEKRLSNTFILEPPTPGEDILNYRLKT
jgi:hypothetical protein